MIVRNILAQLLIIGLLMYNVSAFSAEHAELKAFPAPKEGMERFVIVLPHKERGEEDSFRLEIIVGKEMLTDGVNQVRLGNSIEPVVLEGWGTPTTKWSALLTPSAPGWLLQGVPPWL